MGKWQADLAAFASLFENAPLVSAFDAAAEVITDGFQQNFYNQVDDEHQFWPPRKDNLPHPLLIKTGKMFAAATSRSDPGHLERREGTSLTIGIRGAVVTYATYHHTGTIKMPSRRVIYATPEVVQKAVDAFADAAEHEVLRGL